MILNVSLQFGVQPGDILVITQYRQQQRLILNLLKMKSNHSVPNYGYESVEVLTIDKCQGRDNKCVILSLVRSNSEGKVCGEIGC